LTDVAQTWVSEHLAHEESLYWCGAVVVEPRYLDPIVAGMADQGLVFAANYRGQLAKGFALDIPPLSARVG
jgi:hypothetical protein